jgi:hypothetical protein
LDVKRETTSRHEQQHDVDNLVTIFYMTPALQAIMLLRYYRLDEPHPGQRTAAASLDAGA